MTLVDLNKEETNPEEYNQFLKGMHGMLGGNNGEK